MSFPGRGKSVQRLIAIAIVGIPLVVASFALEKIFAKAQEEVWEAPLSVGAFFGSFLIASFTYDALKTILLIEQEKFEVFWENIKSMLICIAAYVVCVVALALIPADMNSFDWVVGFFFLAASTGFCYGSIRFFLGSVQAACK